MTKKFAQIRPDMWLDDEWRALTKDAQHLYLLLLTDPEMSYCGVVDWRPSRIVQRAAEWTILEMMRAAVELSCSYFLVFDQGTEEVMVRSFMRHDGLLAQPRMAVSVANAFGVVGSNKLRAVIVHELSRLRKETPDLPAWEKPQMKTVLRQTSVDPKTLEVDLDMPLGVDLGVGLGVTLPNVSGSPTTATATTTSTSPSSKEDAVGQPKSYPQGSRSELAQQVKSSSVGEKVAS
jgi:hypothetical protein